LLVAMSKASFHDQYEILGRLGAGQFGTVYKTSEKGTQRKWAAKVINKHKCLAKHLQNEVNIMKKVKHPNAIFLKDVFDNDDSCILILELVSGGELFDRIVDKGVYTEKDAALFAQSMFSVLKHIHDQNIVHRDLKPENILLSDDTHDAVVKLVDFGLSTFAPSNKSVLEVAGTESYMAPEMFEKRGYGKAVDMWAMGVIIFVVLSGLMPYDASLRKFNVEFPSPEFDEISDSAKELILKLLDKNPETRLTVDQALHHPWVAGDTATETSIAIHRLREFNARRKFKRAALAIRSTLRMKGMIGSFKEKAESIVDKRKNAILATEQSLKQIQQQLKDLEDKVVEEINKISSQERDSVNFDNTFIILSQIQEIAKFEKVKSALNIPKSPPVVQATDLAKELEFAEAHRGEYGRKAIEDLQKLKDELLMNIKYVDEIKDNLKKIPGKQ